MIGGRQLVTAQDAPFDIIVAVTVTVDTCFARVWRRDFRQGVDLVLRQLAGIVHIPRNAYNVRPVATIGIVNVPVTDCTIAGAGKIKLKGKKKDNITKVQVHETLGAVVVVVVGFFCHNASSCQQLQDQDRQKQKCCSGASSECKRHRFVLFCFVLFCSVPFCSVLFCFFY